MFVLVENSVKVWAKYLVEFWSYCVSVSFNCRFSRCITMLLAIGVTYDKIDRFRKRRGNPFRFVLTPWTLCMCTFYSISSIKRQFIRVHILELFLIHSTNIRLSLHTHACIVHTVHIHDIQPKILIEKPKYLCYSHLKATENWCHFTWNLCDRARHKQKDESISMNFLGGVCSHFMFCHYLLHVHATQQSFE